MESQDYAKPLETALAGGLAWLDQRGTRAIAPSADAEQMLARLGGPLPDHGQDAGEVIADLVTQMPDGLNVMNAGGFYAWVLGGALPVAMASDLLVSMWDQNSAMMEATPATAAAEQVAVEWIKQLLGLPEGASVGVVTGGQMANFVSLAAARDRVLDAVGWDVETDGLTGAPAIRVVVGAEWHSTVGRALRLLGLGSGNVIVVPTDDVDRMRPDALAAALDELGPGPTIVCTQTGDIHAGAIDPIGALCEVVDAWAQATPGGRRSAWVHVDGAIGLWAAVSDDPLLREQLAGLDRADSWSADAHKWLNTTFDCGLAIVADPIAHGRATALSAAYLPDQTGAVRDPIAWNPEMSRRARGVVLYATLRGLGRDGVAALVDKNVGLARRCAEGLRAVAGIEVPHEVVLNQVSVTLAHPSGDHDGHTRAVCERVRDGGDSYVFASAWHERAVLRVSVCNWSSDESDIDRLVAAITAAHHELGG